MSYAAYSTVNRTGIKSLHVLPHYHGMSGLGQSAADLIDAGVDPGVATTIDALNTSGQYDAQVEAVINNPDSQDAAVALLNQITGNATPPTPADLQSQSLQQTGLDLTDPASWYQITARMQQDNSNLKALEALGAAPVSPAWPAIGPTVISARQQYSSAAQQWSAIYAAVFGSVPSGLSGAQMRLAGLGLAPIVLTTAIIGSVVVILGILYVVEQAITSAQQKAQTAAAVPAQMAASTTQQQLLNQIAATTAQAATATDPVTKNALLAQAQTLSAQLAATGYVAPGSAALAPNPNITTLTNFLTANGLLIFGGILAIAIIPKLIKKL